jgi:phosphohistidine phosphatase
VELLVIRHGVAEDREEFAATGKDDSLRPLTKEGRWKMERGARALRRAIPSLNVIATSPFTRAAQTAKIVAAAYDDVEVEQLDALTPEGRPHRRSSPGCASAESDDACRPWATSRTSGRSCTGCSPATPVEGRIAMKKGGACLLELDARPRAGKATLLWALTPVAPAPAGRLTSASSEIARRAYRSHCCRRRNGIAIRAVDVRPSDPPMAASARPLRRHRAALDSAPRPARRATRSASAAASPSTSAHTTVAIEYGRPVARGRALFGQLVPWDSVWHPGPIPPRASHSTTPCVSRDRR